MLLPVAADIITETGTSKTALVCSSRSKVIWIVFSLSISLQAITEIQTAAANALCFKVLESRIFLLNRFPMWILGFIKGVQSGIEQHK